MSEFANNVARGVGFGAGSAISHHAVGAVADGIKLLVRSSKK